MKIVDKINYIMERYINEQDLPNEDEDKKLIKIFYEDLDVKGKQKILEGIDASFEYVDVFTDDIIRDKIESALSQRPIITVSGEEIVNKMGIDL